LFFNILMIDTITYRSNGKLLLTGEYLVLDAALALGLPTKKGQNLKVQPIATPKIYWESFDDEGVVWFKEVLKLPLRSFEDEDVVTKRLVHILVAAQELNTEFLKNNTGFLVKTKLDFKRNWGLGSSSTLINNIAQWAGVNAFELLQKTMGGSGYDVACAQHDTPILYQLQNQQSIVTPISFSPSYKEQLYFIHLNKKQQSNTEVTRYQTLETGISEAVKTVSEITNLVVKTTHLDDFEILIKEHEKLLSSILKRPTVQQENFTDYFGQLKSLGAWGGDFILATGNEDTPKYFYKKGYHTVLSYSEMLLGEEKGK